MCPHVKRDSVRRLVLNNGHAQEDESVRNELLETAQGWPIGTRRVRCPACSPERRDQRSRTLSVRVAEDHALYICHHCEVQGRVNFDTGRTISRPETKKPIGEGSIMTMHETVTTDAIGPSGSVDVKEAKPIEDSHIKWLAGRGISEDVVRMCGLVSGDIYLAKRGGVIPCIGFPYSNNDGTKAVKWRDARKNWSQTNACRVLWRIDEFNGGDLIICEGEMDALAYEEVGIFATSVPNGAPQRSSDPSGDAKTVKYNYLFESRQKILGANRVIIATDSDKSGQILAEEIARRVGKGKCWRVVYPDDCKDANDVLVKHGADELRNTLVKAMPWPIDGIRDASEFREKAIDLYRNGMDHGVKAGIPDLDKIYTTSPGTLTVFTGIPGNGKSSFLTWLSVKLAAKGGWQSVILSAETPSQIHILQMAAVYVDKPFQGANKMTEDELSAALDWVQRHFTFIDDSDTDVDSVLERASVSIMRYGSRIIQIDPYNFLTSSSPGDDNSVSITKMLVKLKTFAAAHDVAVWLVAHPTKMYRNQEGKVPTPGGMDVAGSAGFFNVCDAGVSLSRGEPGFSKVTCWKARFPWVGSLGETELEYDVNTGQFSGVFQSATSFGYGGAGDEEDFDVDGF